MSNFYGITRGGQLIVLQGVMLLPYPQQTSIVWLACMAAVPFDKLRERQNCVEQNL